MKKCFLLIPAIILVAFTSCMEKTELSDKENEILGAYQYTGNRDGMAIIAKNYFIFVGSMNTESAMDDSLDTAENIQNEFSVEAGKWSLQDSIVTCTSLYNSNPASVGTSFRWTYDIDGDNYTFNVLGDNGEVIGRGSAIKLN